MNFNPFSTECPMFDVNTRIYVCSRLLLFPYEFCASVVNIFDWEPALPEQKKVQWSHQEAVCELEPFVKHAPLNWVLVLANCCQLFGFILTCPADNDLPSV